MSKVLWIIIVAGLLTPQPGQAGSSGADTDEQHLPQQTPVQDASVNKQILQTLMDIRDSQLSVLQAQVEILSILRAQAKTPAAAPAPEAAPASGHRAVAKAHKPKPSVALSAAR